MSFVEPSNTVTSGGGCVFLAGVNFGAVDATPSVAAAMLCGTVAWASITAVTCEMSAGVGPVPAAIPSVAGITGTLSATFSYDGWLSQQLFKTSVPESPRPAHAPAPVVSFTSPANAATSSGTSLTVSGLSYGSIDHTPSVSVAVTLCATTAWASASWVRCELVDGWTTSHGITATISSIVGTGNLMFTFDGAHWLDNGRSG